MKVYPVRICALDGCDNPLTKNQIRHGGKYCSNSHARKGKPKSEETKRKISQAQEGKILSEEHKRKISEGVSYSKKGKKGQKHSTETKRKISEFRKGKKHTDETKRKIAEASIGEKSSQWKGGREKYYGPSWHFQRRKALERDGYLCQNCKKFEVNGREPQVHHIIRFNDFGVERHKEANDLSNLITLCAKCHKKIENNSDGIEICRLILSPTPPIEVYIA